MMTSAAAKEGEEKRRGCFCAVELSGGFSRANIDRERWHFLPVSLSHSHSFFSFVVPTFHPLVGSIQLRPPLQTDIERVGLVLVFGRRR